MRKLTVWGVTGTSGQAPVEEYQKAGKLGGLSFGESHLFIRGITQTHYLPYSEINWVYKRQEDSTASVCCGRTTFESFFLVIHTAEGQSRRIPMGNAQLVDRAIEMLAAKNSQMAVGYTQERANAMEKNA